MMILGITGPTGAGKTTLLREVEKLGGAVIDCDAVYHEMLESDTALQDKLEQAFGPLRDASGKIDRKKLGTIVFNDPDQLKQLNNIVSIWVCSRVFQRIDQSRQEGRTLIAVDAISLQESQLWSICDITVAVLASTEVRVRRIMVREGISEEYAWSRVRAQKPDGYFVHGNKYVKGCDRVLVNDCASAEEFSQKAGDFLAQLLEEGIMLQGWRWDFGALSDWYHPCCSPRSSEKGSYILVESLKSDTACLIYAIYEVRYFVTCSLALFRNKERPELLFNKSVSSLTERKPKYSQDGTYLFLKTQYPERTIVLLILDMEREQFSLFSTRSRHGYAYEVQEETASRFVLRVEQTWMQIGGTEIKALPPLTVEISGLKWRPFAQLDELPIWRGWRERHKQELLSIPLHICWTVTANSKDGLKLEYQHRERKPKHRHLDYGQTILAEREGDQFRLTLTKLPQVGPPQVVMVRSGVDQEALSQALSQLQSWPNTGGTFVSLKIQAGWTALWNTFDSDYCDPDFLKTFLAPPELFSNLHWERDIAMFVNRTRDPELYLDLEEWSNEEMRTAAFRVHLYRWTEEGQKTLAETMTRSPEEVTKKMEEFFQWDCEEP
ncbi:dephospho-CoA kinase [Pseudoflavonifractor sp. 60]|uniref:dephospho-CoA kinase n=1 Tax=Pseudoflavonifractor sp. 60 TaxID=2304576 RepID=UPI00136B4011|nr:dephospho-CoA kinase [Pseudoflavonifractor sp. 60]NBI68016.1 dephospho-CoA kinase [Pseudoflavonifractor sp. 60]